MISLTRDAINTAQVLHSVQSTRAGAVCLFLGTAREFTGDKHTASLEYDAYPEMAHSELAKLEQEARRRWPIIELAIVHRLGPLELGAAAVAVAVSTPHRAEAFEACQWLMDTLKQVVPIWKKEIWSDGTSTWIHPGAGEAQSHRPTN